VTPRGRLQVLEECLAGKRTVDDVIKALEDSNLRGLAAPVSRRAQMALRRAEAGRA